MIQPDDIKREAHRWYIDFLKTSVQESSYFPKNVRYGKIKPSTTLNDFLKLQKEIENLRDQSKEVIGYGYNIDFTRRKDQKIGEQLFPERIYFESKSDYLKFIHKEKEYEKFSRIKNTILTELPDLKEWVSNHPDKIIDNFEKWDDILKVCKYFLKNPKPNIYIRELPLDISTKFVEENRTLIRQLLDILIVNYINKDENEFEKRFNLKYREDLIRIRILDEQLSKNLFFGVNDLSIPQSQFVSLNLPCNRVFVFENHTNFSNIYNFLTLPHLTNSIAIFGKGFNVGLLKSAKWLSDKQIVYWGDIDVHGFQILSQIRGYFPNTISCMMDFETFNEFRHLSITGSETTVTELVNLTSEEEQLFNYLLELKVGNRLEQEKIPHSYAVMKILNAI